MNRVTFSLPPIFDRDLSASLPVKILDFDMVEAAHTIAGKGVDLPLGRYLAQSVLPSGQALQAIFEVGPQAAAPGPVVLQAAGVPVAETKTDLQPATTPRDTRIASALRSGAAATGGLGAFAGEALTGAVLGAMSALAPGAAAAAASGEPPDAKVRVVAAGSLPDPGGVDPGVDLSLGVGLVPPGPPRLLRFVRPGEPVWNVQLPVSAMEGVAVDFRSAGRDWFPHLRMPDAEAELLLQYAASHQTEAFVQLAEDGENLAEAGLAEKVERPVLAILGAYVLLRTGSLDRLHTWTLRLAELFPAMPDAQIVAAEHQARLGDHATALALFLQGAAAGWPMFRPGLRYALDRLAAYQGPVARGELTPKLRPGAAPASLSLTAALDELEALASYVDFQRPILSFTSDLAGKPGRMVVDAATFATWPGREVRFHLAAEPATRRGEEQHGAGV